MFQRIAITLGKVAAALSKWLSLGSGGMIAGKIALKIDPRILERLAKRKSIILVTGTNGKSSTNRMIAEILSTRFQVFANYRGDNMLEGIVTTLMSSNYTHYCLEVDEAYLGQVANATNPKVIVLLNLSRDQLDRFGEVAMLEERLRLQVNHCPETRIIANCDDPLIASIAYDHPQVTWVAAGCSWKQDAVFFPLSKTRIAFDSLPDSRSFNAKTNWMVPGTRYTRPIPSWDLVEDKGEVWVSHGNVKFPLTLQLPGKYNYTNALLALAAADAFGISISQSSKALERISEVNGRYKNYPIRDRNVRLILAKNPAGWQEALKIVGENETIILSINANEADGKDLSWLWDISFDVLDKKEVIVLGKRVLDLYVRLCYEGIAVNLASSLSQAIDLSSNFQIVIFANYTAFNLIKKQLDRLESSAISKDHQIKALLDNKQVGIDRTTSYFKDKAKDRDYPYKEKVENRKNKNEGKAKDKEGKSTHIKSANVERVDLGVSDKIPTLLSRSTTDSSVTICVIYPGFLSTYGDLGNAKVLKARLNLRNVEVQVIYLAENQVIPLEADIYVLGGAEDKAQIHAVELLNKTKALQKIAARNKTIFAVCASFQILGNSFFAQGKKIAGLGILDADTVYLPKQKRMVGELCLEPLVPNLDAPLLGFENHAGATIVNDPTQYLAKVIRGHGNSNCGYEGMQVGNIIATYMHGPALVRNPKLADWLIAKAIKQDIGVLSPLEISEVNHLRNELLHNVR